MVRLLSLIVLAGLLLGATACSSELVQHRAHGVVQSIAPDRLKATIQHDRVPTLDMEPMTMDFQMQDANVLNGIAPKDTIDFIIQTGGASGAVVTRVEKAK